jgi:hypothetical protein
MMWPIDGDVAAQLGGKATSKALNLQRHTGREVADARRRIRLAGPLRLDQWGP